MSPDFDPSTFFYDVGVVTLAKKVDFGKEDPRIAPVCLPKAEPKEGTNVIKLDKITPLQHPYILNFYRVCLNIGAHSAWKPPRTRGTRHLSRLGGFALVFCTSAEIEF